MSSPRTESPNLSPLGALQKSSGDYLIFCSDGIIEATNGAGEQFGFERTAAAIRTGCAEGLSATALLERILSAVTAFRGAAPQGDDQTLVALRVLGTAPPVS